MLRSTYSYALSHSSTDLLQKNSPADGFYMPNLSSDIFLYTPSLSSHPSQDSTAQSSSSFDALSYICSPADRSASATTFSQQPCLPLPPLSPPRSLKRTFLVAKKNPSRGCRRARRSNGSSILHRADTGRQTNCLFLQSRDTPCSTPRSVPNVMPKARTMAKISRRPARSSPYSPTRNCKTFRTALKPQIALLRLHRCQLYLLVLLLRLSRFLVLLCLLPRRRSEERPRSLLANLARCLFWDFR